VREYPQEFREIENEDEQKATRLSGDLGLAGLLAVRPSSHRLAIVFIIA
jgi:hypothetical protein